MVGVPCCRISCMCSTRTCSYLVSDRGGQSEFEIVPCTSFTMRYAVLVTGPAGAGKSTFSTAFATHLRVSKRTAHIVNLDPAATGDAFEYQPAIDIRELVTLDDVMGEMNMGPNGGLVFCFE